MPRLKVGVHGPRRHMLLHPRKPHNAIYLSLTLIVIFIIITIIIIIVIIIIIIIIKIIIIIIRMYINNFRNCPNILEQLCHVSISINIITL